MRRMITVSFWPAVLLGLLHASMSPAAPMYWDTSTDAGIQAGSGTWNDNSATAWSDGTAGSDPLLAWTSSADDAHFYTSGTSTITVAGGVGANSLVFDGAGYTLGANRVTVGAGGIVANQSATIYGATLGATQSVTVAGGKTLTIQNTTVINAGHTWTKNGEGAVTTPGEVQVRAGGGYTHEAGTLEISGGNGVHVVGGSAGNAVFTQTGGTINGTVPYFIIGASGGLTGGTGYKAVFNMQGGALNVTGTLYSGHASDSVITQTGGDVTAARLDIASDAGHGEYYLKGGTLTVSGNVGIGYLAAANGDFVQSGGSATVGSLTLGGHSSGGGTASYTINTNDAPATLTVGSGGIYVARYGSSQSTFNVDGGTVQANGDFRIALSTDTTGTVTQTGGAVTIASNRALQFGAGTGTYHLNGGTLKLANLSFADAAKNRLAFGGGTLENNGSALLTTAIPVELKAGGGRISTPTASAGIHLTGPISGTGRLTKTGDGTLQLSAAAGSTFSGDIYIDAGEIVVDNNNLPTTRGTVRVGTSSSGTGALTLSDWSLRTTSYFMLGAGGSIDSVGVLNMSSGQIEVGSTMYLGWKGSGTVNQTGGTVIVTHPNGIHVATDIDGTTGIYNLHGGTLRTPQINIAAGIAQNRTTLLSFDNGGTLENNGSGLMTTAIPVEFTTGGGVINTPGGGADIRLTGSMSGSGRLTKSGDGTLQLSAAAGSTFNGDIYIDAGEVVVANNNLPTTRGSVRVGTSSSGTGTLTLSDWSLRTTSYLMLGAGGSIDSVGVLNMSSGQIEVGSTMYLGWKGSGTVNQTGGTVIVTHANGIHVATDIDGTEGIYNLHGGTLRTPQINIAAGPAQNRTTLLSFDNGGTLENNGSGLMTTAIPVEIKAGGGTISTPGGGADIRLTGSLTGAGDLTKSGAGTLTLGGTAAAYTGGINVSAGTLRVNTSLAASSGVDVAAGATLGGTGTIGGPTSIRSGGSLATGASVGTLTFLDDLTLANGAIWDWEFIDTSSYDQAVGDNGASLILPTAGSTPAITLNILGEPGHTVDWYDEFTIFTGDVVNFDAGLFDLVNDSDWARGWQIASSGQNLVLTAVPEPGSLVLLAVSLLGLLALGRRRRM